MHRVWQHYAAYSFKQMGRKESYEPGKCPYSCALAENAHIPLSQNLKRITRCSKFNFFSEIQREKVCSYIVDKNDALSPEGAAWLCEHAAFTWAGWAVEARSMVLLPVFNIEG